MQKPTLSYTYQAPVAARNQTPGKPFTIAPSFMSQLGLPPNHFFELTEQTVRDFVFVTAADTRHFVEIKDCVASIQIYFPGYDIHIYDIGLTKAEITEVRNMYRRGGDY